MEEGAVVIAVDRDTHNLKKTSHLCPYQLDVTDWRGLKKLYQDVSVKYGRIDIVCNNAGSFGGIWNSSQLLILAKGDHFWHKEDAESYPHIDTDLSALVKSTRLAISTFLRQPKPKEGGPLGVIVNIASLDGIAPSFTAPVHGASNLGFLDSVED